MSRCFPFPPPGYEKKPTIDDPDLLKKEKRKEKKHKKDKEKRDGKEKREKDKSEGKHKDKKDKKDKHRDKKKDKEKSTTSISDDRNIHVQSEGYNGEFPHQNGDSFSNRNKVGDAQNSKFVQELDRRIRDDEKGMGSHQFAVEGRKNNIIKAEVQKSDGRQVAAFGGNMAVGRVNGATPPFDNRRVDKMNERGSHVVTFGGNVAVGRVNGATPPLDSRRVDKMNERGGDVMIFGGNVAVGRVNGAAPPLDNRRVDKMNERGSDVAAFGGNVVAFGGNVAVPSRSNGAMPPPLGNKRVEKMQEKGNDDKRKSKDRDKEMEMEKIKEKSEQKKAKRDINNNNNNNNIMKSDLVGVANNFSAYRLEKSLQGAGNEAILKKRKAMETNGVSHENEPRPNKMARPISNISPENGRKLDFLQNPSPNLLDKQGASHGPPLNSFNTISSKAGQRVNGMITSQPTSISAKKPPFPAVNHIPSKPSPIKSPPVGTTHFATQSPPTTKPQPPIKPPPNAIAAHQLPPLSSPPPQTRLKPPPAVFPKKKPPHPDTKYLTQILSVPKPDPWSGFDDQEWLYSRKAGPASKKLPVNEPEVQVWSEAKRIESVDVCALPYVIPY
ncbi:uncharacterized protein LOC143576447 [Bidens hawaiensis]|uniref:uncharacterized protein LOC143576447 n=1 Tax=Bidens hawaiensis TaxID=980011 RepID=UPI00404B7BE8